MEKNYLSPNVPKDHQKIHKTAQNVDMWDELRDRDRDFLRLNHNTALMTAFASLHYLAQRISITSHQILLIRTRFFRIPRYFTLKNNSLGLTVN